MIQTYYSRTYFLLCDTSSITLYRLQGKRVAEKNEFQLSPTASLSSVVTKIRHKHCVKADDTLIVGLPLSLFNLITFNLPIAAHDNLAEAVGYELTRHVPFDLNLALYNFATVTQGDQLRVQVVLALKEPLQQYLADLTACGLTITAISPTLFLIAWMRKQDGVYLHCSEQCAEFLVYRGNEVAFSTAKELSASGETGSLSATLALLHNYQIASDQVMLWHGNHHSEQLLTAWDDAPAQVATDISVGDILSPYRSMPNKIEFASAQLQRKKRIKALVQIAAVALVLLSLCAYPASFLLGKHSALSALAQQLSIVRNKAETLDALRQDNQAMRARDERLADYVHSQAQMVDVLKELTDIVPVDTWLGSLGIHERQVTLRGTSASATSVIEALTSSPLFKDVHFDSPVVKRGSQETFTIVATLK